MIDLESYMDSKYINSYNEKLFKNLYYFYENNKEYLGWYKSEEIELEEIKKVGDMLKANSEYLIVIGIGGSYLGTKAVINAIKGIYVESKVIFCGEFLDQDKLEMIKQIIDENSVSVNIISKSGTTMETNITANIVLEYMSSKYGNNQLKKRVIYTTSNKVVVPEDYTYLEIPKSVGGRFSCFTAVSLLPLYYSNIDIDEFLRGSIVTKEMEANAKKYAYVRNTLSNSNKDIELLTVYNERYVSLMEWIQQLLAESLGKNNKGILPVINTNPKNLHSIGQLIEEGKKNIFETVFKIKEEEKVFSNEYGKSLPEINNIISSSVSKSHYESGIPNIVFDLKVMNEFLLGYLMKQMMLSVSMEGFLDNINPYTQEGVEVYKDEVRRNLNV